MSDIVMGYDGSACSDVALRQAVHEAVYRGARLRVVAAVETRSVSSMWTAAVYSEPDASELDAVRSATEDALAKAAADFGGDTLAAEVSVQVGPPARVLLDAAEGADLLVVGSHGHGFAGRLLLGSVSTSVVHQAHCPVLVVRS